jgi:trimeric autotransporter adhesin
MKRFLLTTASAVALGMAAPAMGQVALPIEGPIAGQSDSQIDQIDKFNSATVSQSALSDRTGNYSEIKQGSHNTANVKQSGTNTLNRSIIDQAYDNNTANELTGALVEGARVVQEGDGNRNNSTVTQKTTNQTTSGGNTADVWQYGFGNENTSAIIQDGFSNAVMVWQSGDHIRNNSTVNQTGSENSAHVIQNSVSGGQ